MGCGRCRPLALEQQTAVLHETTKGCQPSPSVLVMLGCIRLAQIGGSTHSTVPLWNFFDPLQNTFTKGATKGIWCSVDIRDRGGDRKERAENGRE
jgi:hypothetical protein